MKVQTIVSESSVPAQPILESSSESPNVWVRIKAAVELAIADQTRHLQEADASTPWGQRDLVEIPQIIDKLNSARAFAEQEISAAKNRALP